ncbi:MAG: cell envelope integrity protein TolA [Candidatus Azotimanducaceae bacterium WSBS_2022_MAG_OTU7]
MNLASNEITTYVIAILFALLFHGVVIGLVSMNWEEPTRSYTELKPYYIDAAIVSENPYRAKEERTADQEQSQRDKKLRERRKKEARLRQEQASWANQQQQKKAEVKTPKPAVIPAPDPIVEKPPETKVDPEAARSEFADELAMALTREANARKAVTDDEKAMAYVMQIQREIVQNWSRPPSARNGMEALLRVRLIPTGEVVDVKIEDSSSNDAFDRSAVLAVTKARRFVVPTDSRRFERDFREFTVLFRPDDLRL